MQGTAGTEKTLGAEALAHGGVHFRVWAPACPRVHVEIRPHSGAARRTELRPEGDGYHEATVPNATHGTRYAFVMPDGTALPDPRSRFQPEGVDGPSEVQNPALFPWTDTPWTGIRSETPVLYELHPGTFTPEGTWAAARERLADLRELGIDGIEVMPLAEFPGRFGWGYDGTCLFAPSRLYGTPDDLRGFIDAAHALGLGVILDVVYNHWGPGGRFLERFSADYVSRRHVTEWGPSPNFDGPNCGPVRRFVLDNTIQWIRDFHFDGLRFDATQQIFDDSTSPILAELSEAARQAAGGRRVYLVAENEPQDSRLLRPIAEGGCGLDAVWNEDYHRAITVALTGRAEAYYTDSRGSAQELVSAVKYGPLFQGQTSRWQKQPRGRPDFSMPTGRWVLFLQNHDQIANSLSGDRIHRTSDAGALRAATALTLLAPCGVLLFQGQEFAASSPFTYFADHGGELGRAVAAGRKEFLSQFPSIAAAQQGTALDPANPEAFERCKLRPEERTQNAKVWNLHRDLLRLRRADPALTRPDRCDGAVLGARAFVLRYFSAQYGDRLLLINLESDLAFEPAPEPLLAPPEGGQWTIAWSSDAPDYGGQGAFLRPTPGGWFLPGHMAALFRPDESGT